MQTKRLTRVMSLAAILVVGVVGSAGAQQMSGGGFVALVPKPAETTETPDGRVLQMVRVDGIVFGDEENNPFGMATQSCAGTVVLSTDGSDVMAKGYCDGVDLDGDVWWITWEETLDGGSWNLLGGTGKFEGVSGGGQTSRVAEWPDGRYVVRWDGTWTMR
jgi:hypothetical protein